MKVPTSNINVLIFANEKEIELSRIGRYLFQYQLKLLERFRNNSVGKCQCSGLQCHKISSSCCGPWPYHNAYSTTRSPNASEPRTTHIDQIKRYMEQHTFRTCCKMYKESVDATGDQLNVQELDKSLKSHINTRISFSTNTMMIGHPLL